MSVLTAANQLTLLRLLLAPVFALCLFYGRPGWALLTFVVAAATDAFDGLLARGLGQPTTLGAWLDPMADKLLITTMFVMLTVLAISRDIAIVCTVAVVNLAIAQRTFRPSFLGKLTTATFLVTGVVALYANYVGERLWIFDACVYVSLALVILSSAQYALHILRPGQDQEPSPRRKK